jgi:dihydrodipicolinate synthase/N-acetylneuraminate lyase
LANKVKNCAMLTRPPSISGVEGVASRWKSRVNSDLIVSEHSINAILYGLVVVRAGHSGGAAQWPQDQNMTLGEAKARLRGIFNITVTPFMPDGGIDFSALSVNIERLLTMGFDGLLIGGTYGEFATMSAEERAALFRGVIKIVHDRVPVLLCSAHSDSRIALELTQLATELGGIPMATPPYVSEVNDEHIADFFQMLAPVSRHGLVIYNAPGVGATLSARMIERLSDMSHIVGLKQGDLTPTAIDELANRLSGKIRLLCASDLAFLGPMTAGFDGLSSTNSCALPEVILKSFRAITACDARTAIELHKSWYTYRELARRFGQPQTVKAAMGHRGWSGGVVRAPLKPLMPEQSKELGKVLDLIMASGNPAQEKQLA